MSRYGNRSAEPRGGSSQVWAGIFVGMVVGAGMAAVLTWYMMKSPSPYLAKAPVAEKLPPSQAASAETVPASTPVSSEKPRFEFYNVLTDKQNAGSSAPPVKQVASPKVETQVKPVEGSKSATYTPQILQIGSFSNNADAEKLKAKLAMIGAESHIQVAKVPDRGVFYRVRLGPYKSEAELNQARNFLKQNDLDSTPMRAQ